MGSNFKSVHALPTPRARRIRVEHALDGLPPRVWLLPVEWVSECS